MKMKCDYILLKNCENEMVHFETNWKIDTVFDKS